MRCFKLSGEYKVKSGMQEQEPKEERTDGREEVGRNGHEMADADADADGAEAGSDEDDDDDDDDEEEEVMAVVVES